MKETHAVLADVEKMIKSAIIYEGLYNEQHNLDSSNENYNAQLEEHKKKMEPWGKELGLEEDGWSDLYKEIDMGKVAIDALNLVVNDYKESGMSLEQYARGLRKIYLTPENQNYIYITPLKIQKRRGLIENNGIENWHSPIEVEITSKEKIGFSTIGKKSDIEKMLENNEIEEKNVELLGLTFPWWGVYKDDEPVTDMLFRCVDFLKERTDDSNKIRRMNENDDLNTSLLFTNGEESCEEDEIYMINDRFYRTELSNKNMKGIFCFVEKPEFDNMCNFYGFPLKEEYTLGERCFDEDVLNKLAEMELGRCYTKEEFLKEAQFISSIYNEFGEIETRRSFARLASMGMLGAGLDLLRKTPNINYQKRLNEIMQNGDMKPLLELFRENYLVFGTAPEDGF
ncbi:MAG: hypothetical protein GOV02_01265 [Candidatus Aenigmarchaeota archaeon]|nr:hypothetical protein [Candidatus Aenigmarchaeota archaeon]